MGPDTTVIASRQVAFFEAFMFAAERAAASGVNLIADPLPLPGTPQWCGLPGDDPRKVCALLLGGCRDALRHETEQQARAEASRDISAAADWSAIARRIRAPRGAAHIPREKAS
jgi:hypothetical protein